MNHFDGAGRRQRVHIPSAARFCRQKDQDGPQSLAGGEEAVAHGLQQRRWATLGQAERFFEAVLHLGFLVPQVLGQSLRQSFSNVETGFRLAGFVGYDSDRDSEMSRSES
jgi:hypothetical protein